VEVSPPGARHQTAAITGRQADRLIADGQTTTAIIISGDRLMRERSSSGVSGVRRSSEQDRQCPGL